MAILANEDVSQNQKYVDQIKAPILRQAVLGSTTFIAPNAVSILTGIKNAETINPNTSVLTVQAGCQTNGSLISTAGTYSFVQRTLTVCQTSVIEQIQNCLTEQYWMGMKMPAGSYIKDLSPKELYQVYTADKIAKIQKFNDQIFWQGSTGSVISPSGDSNMALCNGIGYILQQTSASASIVIATASIAGFSGTASGGVGGQWTAANALVIADQMVASMIANVSDIITMDDLTLFVGPDMFNALVIAFRNANYFHLTQGQEEGYQMTIRYPNQNILVKSVVGLLATKTAYLTYAKNFYFGVDMENDYETFDVWFEQLYNSVFFRANQKTGAQVAYPGYVVMYQG